MKSSILIGWVLIVAHLSPKAQVTGLWKVVDDKDGIEKSIVEIYEQDDRYYGRVVKLLEASKRTHCDNCDGQLKGRPLTGMIILYDIKKTNKGGKDGKVLHPANGKIYSCILELETPDKLKVRGYLGVPTLGITQYWNRLK